MLRELFAREMPQQEQTGERAEQAKGEEALSLPAFQELHAGVFLNPVGRLMVHAREF
jgi:hypothetical protein